MSDKYKKGQIIIIIVLALVTVFGIIAVHHQSKEIDDLKNQKQHIKVPDKRYVDDKTSQKDVKVYQDKVEDKLHHYYHN